MWQFHFLVGKKKKEVMAWNKRACNHLFNMGIYVHLLCTVARYPKVKA
jgi:hypothetical protein